MKASDLLSAWEAAAAQAGTSPGYYRRRLDIDAAVALYAGILLPGKLRQITIRFSYEIFGSRVIAQLSRGYVVTEERQDSDENGCIFIHISEATPKLPQEIFLVFCADVLESITRAQTESTAADILQLRLSHWRLFFQNRAQSLLSREEYIGLYGELDFLNRCLDADMPVLAAVQSWNGPLGTNQDFLFSGTAVEVKATVSNDPDVIRVSNARQLDDIGLSALFLTHAVYDFRPNVDQSLMALVNSIRDRLKSAADALAVFNERLSFAGLTGEDTTEFAKFGFTIRRRIDYVVTSEFPRIVESTLAPGISEVSYVLHLSAARSFALEQTALMEAIRAALDIS